MTRNTTQRRSSKRHLALLPAIALVSVAAACGGSDDPVSTDAPATTAVAGDTTVPETTMPATTTPETTVPETTVPATAVPETTMPATTAPATTVATPSGVVGTDITVDVSAEVTSPDALAIGQGAGFTGIDTRTALAGMGLPASASVVQIPNGLLADANVTLTTADPLAADSAVDARITYQYAVELSGAATADVLTTILDGIAAANPDVEFERSNSDSSQTDLVASAGSLDAPFDSGAASWDVTVLTQTGDVQLSLIEIEYSADVDPSEVVVTPEVQATTEAGQALVGVPFDAIASRSQYVRAGLFITNGVATATTGSEVNGYVMAGDFAAFAATVQANLEAAGWETSDISDDFASFTLSGDDGTSQSIYLSYYDFIGETDHPTNVAYSTELRG